jgi:hypothetical protein
MGLLGCGIATAGCTLAHAQPPIVDVAVSITPVVIAQPGASPNPYDYFDGISYDASIPSPSGVLGHAIGERFTPHHDVVRYCEAVTEASDRVTMARYGTTHEGRSLHTLFVTSPANHARLGEILENNRSLSDPTTSETEARRIIESNPAIVWHSYNVHGNEASSSETAMQVLYTMAAGQNDEIRDILDRVVFVIDPMVNPDGRDRYVNWYRGVVGTEQNSHADATEHDEPWPGGRTNHYYFDLNRDWLWLVHPESSSRIAAYRQVLPQLHIDYHEQGYRSPYFFGAGDDPYNTNIPTETREWVERYGSANAEVFDRNGLVYATKERFDYLYPGYGKVMPVYHGAVGMLCEQAGHGFAGLAIDIDDDNTLTLQDRARHHFLTSMSYLETTAANREGQLDRFRRFFVDSTRWEDEGPKAFFIRPNDPAKLELVWDLCTSHGIEIHTLREDSRVEGLSSYRTGEAAADGVVPAGTWVIPAGQRMGRLARAIFERSTTVTHIETYDITGWSVPISFGLDATYTDTNVDLNTTPLESWSRQRGRISGSGDVAVVVDSGQHDFPKAIGLAMEHELICRTAGDAIAFGDERFAMGSLIAYRVRNGENDLDGFVERCLEAGIDVHLTDSGMTTEGHVLGADDNGHYTMPSIALVRGTPTSSYSFGQLWHYLDIQYPMPHTSINADALGRADLDRYNVLVLPDAFGGWERTLGEATVERLGEWVRGGGTIVAIGGSAQWSYEELVEGDDEEQGDDEEDDDERPDRNTLTWQEREDRRVEDNIPGAMFRATVDTTHPMSAGVGSWVGALKRGDRTLELEEGSAVVARFDEHPFVGGYSSERNRESVGGTAFMAHHSVGRGNVIGFSDDVTIRGFMHTPVRLILNAIIYGPSM